MAALIVWHDLNAGRVLQLIDWTGGSNAVTNRAMDEIWALVQDGTPIETNP
ncbi:hypothetical protein ACTJJ7_04790 [Phyllobacterium sp. 22229]|uniref:hypothetical protein n=1 Tax=Phyllobacterium sp. 22229 TaxID=3453895 RepID=UPI003F880103